jgi:hypothetical protein
LVRFRTLVVVLWSSQGCGNEAHHQNSLWRKQRKTNRWGVVGMYIMINQISSVKLTTVFMVDDSKWRFRLGNFCFFKKTREFWNTTMNLPQRYYLNNRILDCLCANRHTDTVNL